MPKGGSEKALVHPEIRIVLDPDCRSNPGLRTASVPGRGTLPGQHLIIYQARST
jgi:hypothetical protein